MNYVRPVMNQLGKLLGDCPPDLLRLYALLVLTRGQFTSREDVHEAWAIWRDATRPDHPSLVPFSELSPEVQALDDPYVEAIRTVARGLGNRA